MYVGSRVLRLYMLEERCKRAWGHHPHHPNPCYPNPCYPTPNLHPRLPYPTTLHPNTHFTLPQHPYPNPNLLIPHPYLLPYPTPTYTPTQPSPLHPHHTLSLQPYLLSWYQGPTLPHLIRVNTTTI